MPDRSEAAALAEALAMGGAMGGIGGAIGGDAIGGMTNGLAATGAQALARHLMPQKADAAGLMTQGAMMGFPLGVPAGLGGLLMMLGAKPTPTDQLTGSEPSYE
jgi:hypothetical protein